MYIAQANAGIIAESMVTKRRSCFGMTSRVSSLSDIAIYTEEDEVKLQDVFEKMKAHLNGGEAPSQKSGANEIKAFFEAVLPDYDRDRFYVSHMKKVLEWYNLLRSSASLDFEDENSAAAETEEKAE